jgi:AcrR family transcriptional regulator
MPAIRKAERRRVVSDLKRGLILEAARKVFEAEGLDGASLRSIAAEAGYTPAALYFHFESKEDIYAEALRESLAQLGERVAGAISEIKSPGDRLRAAALAFFNFYANNPRDLDLGFYLFRGGMKPHGLGKERDELLNAGLKASLFPLYEAAKSLGASDKQAKYLMVDIFAHAAGLLLLAHTGRIRMFDVSAPDLMQRFVESRITALKGRRRAHDSRSPGRRGALQSR